MERGGRELLHPSCIYLNARALLHRRYRIKVKGNQAFPSSIPVTHVDTMFYNSRQASVIMREFSK
ncbi:hypothetical protein GCM10028868_32120 [Virgibacillus kimchii]